MFRNFFSYFIPFFLLYILFSSYIYIFFCLFVRKFFQLFFLFLIFSFHFFFSFFFFLLIFISARRYCFCRRLLFCLSVCLWTTLPNQTKTADHIFMKILPRMYIGIRKSFITIWKSSVESRPYLMFHAARRRYLRSTECLSDFFLFLCLEIFSVIFSHIFFHFFFISYKYWVN